MKLIHYYVKNKENKIVKHVIADVQGNIVAKCRFESQIAAYVEKKIGKKKVERVNKWTFAKI